MEEQLNLYDTATRNDKFSTLTKVIDAAGLDNILKVDGPFTLFAPTNEAFAKLPESSWNQLLKPANKARLVDVLKYHVVPGSLVPNVVKNVKFAQTLQGEDVSINAIADSDIQVNNAKATTPGLSASNGLLLPIDAVLIPQSHPFAD